MAADKGTWRIVVTMVATMVVTLAGRKGYSSMNWVTWSATMFTLDADHGGVEDEVARLVEDHPLCT